MKYFHNVIDCRRALFIHFPVPHCTLFKSCMTAFPTMQAAAYFLQMQCTSSLLHHAKTDDELLVYNNNSVDNLLFHYYNNKEKRKNRSILIVTAYFIFINISLCARRSACVEFLCSYIWGVDVHRQWSTDSIHSGKRRVQVKPTAKAPTPRQHEAVLAVYITWWEVMGTAVPKLSADAYHMERHECSVDTMPWACKWK